jgi:hypothetical protein
MCCGVHIQSLNLCDLQYRKQGGGVSHLDFREAAMMCYHMCYLLYFMHFGKRYE